jgi:hypothetical protein
MGLKATVTKVDATLNHFVVKGTIATSGSYPGSGNGDVLDFTVLGVGPVPFPATTQVPDDVRIFEAPAAGTSAAGLLYNFSPGTTQKNGKVQLFQSAGSAAVFGQVGNVTYASLTIVNLSFTAWFPKFQ